MNSNFFSSSAHANGAGSSDDYEFNYAVPAPSPAPPGMMAAATAAGITAMSTNYANDDFNDLEDKLCELMIDEDTLDHSPLASVQEIDADENDEAFKAKESRLFRIDDEQIIDDKQLLEHQENDQSFLINDNLIKLFRIYQKIVEKKRAERGHHGRNHNDSNAAFDYEVNGGGGGGNNDMELMEQEVSENVGSDFEEEEDDSRVRINEMKSVLMTGGGGGCGDGEENVHDEESAHNAFFNGTLSEAELMIYEKELPRNLIVTSIPSEVFEKNNEYKAKFEKLFLDIDPQCKFCYFRIFKRCCIQYENGISAVLARFQLDDQVFLNDRLRIFLTKPIKLKNSRPFLEPPQNEKTFLISPPSSPPVGWEQNFEDPPIVNLDLIAALSKLNPDQPCEIVKSTSDNMPSIIIHPCPDLINDLSDDKNFKRKFMPTKRPAFDFS